MSRYCTPLESFTFSDTEPVPVALTAADVIEPPALAAD
jgi:hypothetical protein